jgi:hypothetical protein
VFEVEKDEGGLEMSRRTAVKIVAMVLAMLMLSVSVACAATKEEKRQHIRDISKKTLEKLMNCSHPPNVMWKKPPVMPCSATGA